MTKNERWEMSAEEPPAPTDPARQSSYEVRHYDDDGNPEATPMTENTRATVASLIELNEPEALVATLAFLCRRKSEDKLTVDEDRARWRKVAEQLTKIAGSEPAVTVDNPPTAA